MIVLAHTYALRRTILPPSPCALRFLAAEPDLAQQLCAALALSVLASSWSSPASVAAAVGVLEGLP